MTPERLREVEAIYFELLDLPASEREQRLKSVPDTDLREDVRSLLQASTKADLAEIARSAASSLLSALQPERFGPWRVTGLLGEGGIGAVYRAVRDDGAYQREVAIKLLPTGMQSSNLRHRFLQERQILATLDHPNIAHMLDGGEHQTGSYIVLELIDGSDIVSYCEDRRLSTEDRLRLFLPVCAAVQYAHDRGIIHRDLKPANILVTQHGTPKLLDFGIAKLLERGTLQTALGFQAFTPQYASPEQIRGGPLTAATDVYSLGSLLYELLTGIRPHALLSGDHAELVKVICEQDIPRAGAVVRDFDRNLEVILQKATRRDPARRYASVELLAADISRYLDGKSVLARPDGIAYRAATLATQHAAAGAISIGVLALLAAFAIVWFHRQTVANPLVVAPLTSFPGTEVSPSFSPDGKQVAFAWDGDAAKFDIYIKRLGSEAPQRITHGPGQNVNPAWSHDSKQIAFLRILPDRADLMITELGGSERRLTSINNPQRVALAQFTVFRHYGPVWSPVRDELAVAGDCAAMDEICIYLVSAHTGEKRLLTTPDKRTLGDHEPSFSPDGARLAFSRSKSIDVSDIYVQPVSGGTAVRLTFDERSIDGITWSHDGRDVIFSSERSGNPQLWKIPASGGVTQAIDVGSRNVLQPAISPRGDRLAYVETVTNQNIWRMSIHSDGSKRPSKLIFSSRKNDSARYSPDGKHLAFASDRSGAWEIWVANSDGTDPVQITRFNAGLSGSPNWSPDNREIVFDSRQQDYSAVYIVPAVGGTPRLFTEKTADDMLPSWSKDGHWIYFNSNRSGSHEIWKKPVAGGPALQVTRNGAYEPYQSSDGRYIYFWKYEGTGVWRINPEGGQEEFVSALKDFVKTRYFDVAKDGIYFIANRTPPHTIQFFRFATGEVKPIGEIERSMAAGTPGLSMSPEGNWLAYTQVDYNSTDIYMLDNFR